MCVREGAREREREREIVIIRLYMENVRSADRSMVAEREREKKLRRGDYYTWRGEAKLTAQGLLLRGRCPANCSGLAEPAPTPSSSP